MSSFRPIRPAPLTSSDPGRPPQEPPVNQPKKKNRNAAQACNDCRRSKIKCTGEVPRCSNCITRNKPCGYEGAGPGVSRQEAAKTRLETLEKLLVTLQGQTPTENESLLQRIKSGESIISIVDEPATSPGGAEFGAEESRESASGSKALSFATVEPIITKGKAPEDTLVEISVQKTEVLVELAIPNPLFVKQAIEAFFSSTGKLFQFFSRQQVARYYEMVFEQDSGEVSKVAVCCVALVAAMGLQYEQSEEDASRERMDELYGIARYYYEAVIIEHPLDAIKACGLLAMFNIFDKVTISLAYIEVGLSIAKRHGLDKKWHDPLIPDDIWIDYRKAWRTLMFLSSWLSFTIGYMSGSNTARTEKMVLAEFDIDNPTNIVDLVQSELTKISILKADILRLNLLFKDLSFLTIESILLDLREWHAQLPSVMLLDNVQHAVLPWNLRLTIYHVHLLYLGAFMLLYRRIASQIVRTRGLPGDRTLAWRPSKELARCAEEGVQAAKSSARILATLMAENGVFKKCWLVIYQAYTACTVVLYAVAQKQLRFLPAADMEEDLECVRMCLATLEYCGSRDPVASKFYTKLSSIFQQLTDYTPDAESMFRSGSGVVTDSSQLFGPEYLLQFPEDGDPEMTSLALDLLVMLCKPFGGLENKEHVDDNIANAWRTDPTRYEYPHLIERLEWNVENSVPFQWDMGQLSSGSSGVLSKQLVRPLPSRFLGSTHPNGWSVFLDSTDTGA